MPTPNFTSVPTLTTERLTLRQLSMDDKQDIFSLRSDTEINKYLDREPSKTIEDAINFINQVTNNTKLNTSRYWVITLTKTKILVGTICLFEFSEETDSCEIGYELFPKYQGQGIMKEALERILDYAFETLHFQNIIAHTHKNNLNSAKLLTRFNFLQSQEEYKENPDFIILILKQLN